MTLFNTWQALITHVVLFDSLCAMIVCRCSDPEEDICLVAGQTNRDLLALVRETQRAFELSPLLQTLAVELRSHHVPTRMAALRLVTSLVTSYWSLVSRQ